MTKQITVTSFIAECFLHGKNPSFSLYVQEESMT